jgi:hypothetical protein
MNRRQRAILQLISLVIVVGVLSILFPSVYRVVQMAGRELRTLWWLVLVVALAGWLIWGVGRRPK